MTAYTLDTGREPGVIQAKDAADARRKAAEYMASNEVREADLVGPNGHVWRIFYEGFAEGKAGWMYSDGDGERNVFPAQSARPGTLYADNWTGVYELDDGRFLMADESEEFTDEDFAVIGAVYYNIYDESGEVDGGWYGYDEDATWKDFVKFVAAGNGPRIGRRIWDGGVDGFYNVVDILEEGADAQEVYDVCGVRPRSALVRSRAGVKHPAGKTCTKPSPSKRGSVPRPGSSGAKGGCR